MTLDLTDDESRALVEDLKATIAADPFPRSPRLRMLRAILAKLEPETRPERLPPPKPPGEPSWTVAKKRRRR